MIERDAVWVAGSLFLQSGGDLVVPRWESGKSSKRQRRKKYVAGFAVLCGSVGFGICNKNDDAIETYTVKD